MGRRIGRHLCKYPAAAAIVSAEVLHAADGSAIGPRISSRVDAGQKAHDGANLVWEINQASGIIGTHTDLLSISGALTVTATSASRFTISLVSLTSENAAGLLAGFNSAQDYSYTIAQATGGIPGFDTSDFTLNTSAFTNDFTGIWSISATTNALSLNYTASAIPEPSTYAALAGVAALALAAWRRRKPKQKTLNA